MSNFYKGWPHKGPYVNKLNKINENLTSYLNNMPRYKPFTVIFDIDDTLVYTDPLKQTKYNSMNVIKGYMIFPEIKQISSIARLCRKLGYKIIIITARPYESEQSSIKNLEHYNIPYDKIYHNIEYPSLTFKLDLIKNIAKKHNVLLAIGDSWPDIKSLKKCLCIKLPNRNDTNSYFTYDNKNYYNI